MASETSKAVKVPDEQEVTSHQRGQSFRAGSRAATAAQEPSSDNPLARQSSILSLTLEELQNSLCEPGRNFGSMNMDEFVANIWNADEFQAATGGCKDDEGGGGGGALLATGAGGEGAGGGGSGGLCRQGSFALPPPLSRKTVEEATLGEMTLEDFLVKAGVVRGSFAGHQAVGMVPAGPMAHMQQQQAGHHQLAAAPMMFQVAPPGNAVYPVMGDGGMGYHHNSYHPGGLAVVPPPPPPPSQCVAAAVSPGSSDGMSAMTQAEMMSCIGNGGGMGRSARKRESPEDGCTEKTVERRQRRMIKNQGGAPGFVSELMGACHRFVLVSAGGEDDRAVEGERERQEERSRDAPLRQFHVHVISVTGHGRSVCVMCALLVALGLAEDWKAAEQMIREKRPSISMNTLHRKSLEEWSKHLLSSSRSGESDVSSVIHSDYNRKRN
ncbi:hypothetical protein PR202_ga08965 [Eleusine coracana subsp. coracana]|uniref:Uncharacterized protein n=1 Tax=Eleusine coracana subsp. coracana TaxID=191504 RepID=A0AAV5C1D2_ELECO|nr:hypothetical protein PR202_ga08965 [Eleusine coracana subsp. coracana]